MLSLGNLLCLLFDSQNYLCILHLSPYTLSHIMACLSDIIYCASHHKLKIIIAETELFIQGQIYTLQASRHSIFSSPLPTADLHIAHSFREVRCP